ncbi:MAG: aminotransferase class IV [Candidatus Omnitrophota bacterium]
MTVFVNGKFVPCQEARVSVLSPGFLHGWGLFETMRSLNNKIVYLNSHLARLKNSSKLIGLNLKYPAQKIKKIIRELVKIHNLKDAYIRVTLWKEEGAKSGISVIARKYKPLPQSKKAQGFVCLVSGLRQSEGSNLTHCKAASLFYQLAYKEAKDAGLDEAIILNNAGIICEGSRTNIFLVRNSELFTPALDCGCLPGITRQVVLDIAKKNNLKVNEGEFILQDLYSADEVFLTNSLMGVMPIKSVEGLRIGKTKGKDSPAAFLSREYNKLLQK